MKKQARFLVWLPFAAALSFTCLFTYSCQKEIPDPVEDYIPLDEVNSLVGYFNSYLGIALIDPAYLETVLSEWGAYPTAQGSFALVILKEDGTKMEFSFQVEPIPAPDLFQQAMAINLESVGLDEDGAIKYTYTNAKCPDQEEIEKWQKEAKDKKTRAEAEKKLGEGFRAKSDKPTGCTNLEQVDQATQAASYHSQITKDYKKCMYSSSPKNSCTETLIVIGKTSYYKDLDCKGGYAQKVDSQGKPQDYIKEYKQYSCGLHE